MDFASQEKEFERLKRLEKELRSGIQHFRGAERLKRKDTHRSGKTGRGSPPGCAGK